MKNKTLLLIGGGVCLLFAVFSGCGGHPGEKDYNKAMASWKKNDLVRAESQLEKAIRKLSGNEEKSVANNQLGIILWNLGKHDQAIESFGESCRLGENLSGANLNLGIALYYAGQSEQAELEFTKILNEEPDHAVARFFLGLVHMQKKDWKGASQEIIKGLGAEPNDAAGQNALALAELHLNRKSDVAVKRLKQLVAAHSDYAVDLAFIVKCLHHEGRAGTHDLHRLAAILLLTQFGQIATTGMRRFIGLDVHREKFGRAHNPRVHGENFTAQVQYPFTNECILRPLCVERAYQTYLFHLHASLTAGTFRKIAAPTLQRCACRA